MYKRQDEYTGNLNYKNKRQRYEEQEVESDPYYISSDFSIVYFSCIQIWLSAFNDYISKNMVFSVLIVAAGKNNEELFIHMFDDVDLLPSQYMRKEGIRQQEFHRMYGGEKHWRIRKM